MATALFPDLVVNGERVPRAAIAAEAQNHPAPAGKPGLAWRRAAEALAVRTLLLQEARRLGLTADPEEVAPGRFETDEEALIRAVLEQAVAVDPPDAATVHREWQRDPERFRSPPLWEVSHILCAAAPDDAAAREAAQERAEGLLGHVLASPQTFAALAAEQSDCGSRANGGRLGQLRPGDTVPAFEAALRALRPGEVTLEPVETDYGFHVIRLDAAAGGEVLPFAAVERTLAEALEKAAWTRAARGFAADLVAAAEISGARFDPVAMPDPS
ncbi:MAG: peptidylprolyl isomerase [Alphaproteobacteria bacterium]|nr:peptidylprolyl isomerase [Alphaproteobacteria bacterium]MCB9931256.1 peptidylprolyl isomerase [Alphaproteobacteria bacterium]